MNEQQRTAMQRTLAMSRLISGLEERRPEAVAKLKGLYGDCGRAHILGITGPPGAGKSCLVAALAEGFRRQGKSVGILAVDPSSPFSGGALLGDRDRMLSLSNDREIYLRSFATRGNSGGLAAVINDAVDVLDAFGKEVILIETVGVGQIELAVAQLAHSVLLVLVPGYGDALQAMKAGIMEIGDVIVMNKSDQPGAERAVNDLSFQAPVTTGRGSFPCHRHNADQWGVPVVRTCSLDGSGIDDLVALSQEHYAHLAQRDLLEARNRRRRKQQFLDILGQTIRESFMATLQTDSSLQSWVERIEAREVDPYSAAERVVAFIKLARERALITNKPPVSGGERQ